MMSPRRAVQARLANSKKRFGSCIHVLTTQRESFSGLSEPRIGLWTTFDSWGSYHKPPPPSCQREVVACHSAACWFDALPFAGTSCRLKRILWRAEEA